MGLILDKVRLDSATPGEEVDAMLPYRPFQLVTLDEYPEGLHLKVLSPLMLDDQSGELYRECAAVLREYPAPRVVLDLGGVTMVSSAGVSVVLMLLAQVRKRGGDMVLAGLVPVVESVFRMCQLLETDDGIGVVQSWPDAASALASFRKKAG
jgi:anti-anti-sigma factor